MCWFKPKKTKEEDEYTPEERRIIEKAKKIPGSAVIVYSRKYNKYINMGNIEKDNEFPG